MTFLKMLESIRTPFWDQVAAAVTLLGEETFFMLVGLALVWCFDKRWGFRLLFAGLTGTVLNQLLKAVFLIPRPWVLDPNFTIVEAARAGATGYSFPSGHTQSAATVLGMLAVWVRNRYFTVVCMLGIIAVALSRMYLGVHTPLDVGVSLITGLATVAVMPRLFDRAERSVRGQRVLAWGMLGFALLLLLYVLFWPKREGNVAEFDAHGVESAWTLFGTMCGLLIAWQADRRWLHFDTHAVWWAQALKLVLGLVLVIAVRIGLKAALAAIFGNAPFTDGVRYLCIALAGGVLWPMTFGFWGRLGRKQYSQQHE
ncbi:MAG: phosphatase PAP2 family protein [Candidatus Limiplasma sp.]|nr:phosphatase PAP2 family protein [Candidatus Limiplasma sp.]